MISFKVNYNNIEIPINVDKNISISNIIEKIVLDLHVSCVNFKEIHLAEFRNEYLILYVSEKNRHVLDNGNFQLTEGPVTTVSNIIQKLNKTEISLHNSPSETLDKNVLNQLVCIKNCIGCPEFFVCFIENNGIKAMLDLMNVISTRKISLDGAFNNELWSTVLSVLGKLAQTTDIQTSAENYTSEPDCLPSLSQHLPTSSSSYLDIIDANFIINMVNVIPFLTDLTSGRNVLLVLIEVLQKSPDYIPLFVEGNCVDFIYQLINRHIVLPNTDSSSTLTRSVSDVQPNNTTRTLKSTQIIKRPDSITHTLKVQLELSVLCIRLIGVIFEHASTENPLDIEEFIRPNSLAPLIQKFLPSYRPTESRISKLINFSFPNQPAACFGDEISPSKQIVNWTRLGKCGIKNVNALDKNSASLPVSNPLALNDYCDFFLREKYSLAGSPIQDTNEDWSDIVYQANTVLRPEFLKLQDYLLSSIQKDYFESVYVENESVEKILKKIERLGISNFHFSDPDDPLKDFEASPGRLGVNCFSALLDTCPDLVNHILASQQYSTGKQGQFCNPRNCQKPQCSTKRLMMLSTINSGLLFPIIPVVLSSVRLLYNFFFSSDDGTLKKSTVQFYPIVFEKSKFGNCIFIDIFLRVFMAFYDTWSTVNASLCDIDQIALVTQNQFEKLFACHPITLEDLSLILYHINLESVKNTWFQADCKLQEKMQKSHPAIRDLRRELMSKHIETVSRQRLNIMKTGVPLKLMLTKSLKYEIKHVALDSDYLNVNLSPDHNSLLIRNRQNAIVAVWPFSTITNVVPGIEEKQSKQADRNHSFYMDKQFEEDKGESPLNVTKPITRKLTLTASSEVHCIHWIDGLCVLKKSNKILQDATIRESERFAEDLNDLVEMEMSVRLLGLNLVTVPEVPPIMPTTVPNLDGLVF